MIKNINYICFFLLHIIQIWKVLQTWRILRLWKIIIGHLTPQSMFPFGILKCWKETFTWSVKIVLSDPLSLFWKPRWPIWWIFAHVWSFWSDKWRDCIRAPSKRGRYWHCREEGYVGKSIPRGPTWAKRSWGPTQHMYGYSLRWEELVLLPWIGFEILISRNEISCYTP